MLAGPDAPLVVEPVIASHMENVYDFYKPYGIFPQVSNLVDTLHRIARPICDCTALRHTLQCFTLVLENFVPLKAPPTLSGLLNITEYLCQVDGQLSIKCYLQAIDRCYSLLCRKFDSRPGPDSGSVPDQPFSLASVAFCVMHVSFLTLIFASAELTCSAEEQ